jgi:DUF2075 family protein
VVIGAEFGRKNHGSIPATAIGRGLKSLDVKADTRIRLNWCKYQKTMYKNNNFITINKCPEEIV